MPSESTIRSKLSTQLRKQNAVVIPQMATKYGLPGVPDIFVSHRWWSGFIESKKIGEKLRGEQVDVIKMLVQTGTKCALVEFVDDSCSASARLRVVSFTAIRSSFPTPNTVCGLPGVCPSEWFDRRGLYLCNDSIVTRDRVLESLSHMFSNGA